MRLRASTRPNEGSVSARPTASSVATSPEAWLLVACLLVSVAVLTAFATLRGANGNTGTGTGASPAPGAATASGDATGTGQSAAAMALVPDAVGPPLEVYPTGAVHVVGTERFAVGLVDPAAGPVEAGRTDLLFFQLVGNQGTLTETLPAPFMPYGVAEEHPGDHPEGGDVTGIFAARPTFDVPGEWGVVARVTMPDGTRRAGQADFRVDPDTPVPGPGDAAVASETLTARTPDEASAICTADPVDGMHAMSLDDALGSGKPTVVLFATPALCASRTCGPSLAAVEALRDRYGESANFVHVEIYPGRVYEEPAPAVAEWNLPSEPWLFLVGADGAVVERYEGGIGVTELDPAIRALIG